MKTWYGSPFRAIPPFTPNHAARVAVYSAKCRRFRGTQMTAIIQTSKQVTLIEFQI